MEREPREPSKKERQEAERFGGGERDNYNLPDTTPGCDRGGHRERSEQTQPNHQEHWRKEEKRQS